MLHCWHIRARKRRSRLAGRVVIEICSTGVSLGAVGVKLGRELTIRGDVHAGPRVLQRAEEMLGKPVGRSRPGSVEWAAQVVAAEAARIHALALLYRGTKSAEAGGGKAGGKCGNFGGGA